jgi:hypothetical protein
MSLWNCLPIKCCLCNEAGGAARVVFWTAAKYFSPIRPPESGYLLIYHILFILVVVKAKDFFCLVQNHRMAVQTRSLCSYCSQVIPEQGPLLDFRRLDEFHPVRSPHAADPCGLCNVLVVNSEPFWKSICEPDQYATFDDFVSNSFLSSTIEPIGKTESGLSWALWEAIIRTREQLNSTYSGGCFRFLILACESRCTQSSSRM